MSNVEKLLRLFVAISDVGCFSEDLLSEKLTPNEIELALKEFEEEYYERYKLVNDVFYGFSNAIDVMEKVLS